LNWRFLGIGIVMLFLGLVSIGFTVGYFFFGWGGPYKYELFYFPSPVAFTLDSLTNTGRMLSFILPVAAFLALVLSAEVIRIPSSKMISTEQQRQHAGPLGAPKLNQYPIGILAVSASGDRDLDDTARASRVSVKHDYLGRLFPYERNDGALGIGQISMNVTIEPEKRKSQITVTGDALPTLLTTT
jgi:hypothetical protein